MEAGDCGYQAVIEVLLKAGADANIKDKHQATALMWAAHRDHHAVVQLLLERCPDLDLNAQNKRGDTALKIAQFNQCKTVVKLLKAAGAR